MLGKLLEVTNIKAVSMKVKKLRPNAMIPKYATPGSACFDIHACIEASPQYETVSFGNPSTIATGLSFEIPPGFVMKIYSRSGHGFKNGMRLANCVGIIDSDYRGEVMVKLTIDEPGDTFFVRHGDRIAQAEIVPVLLANFVEVDELSETKRGTGGFGSTGTEAL